MILYGLLFAIIPIAIIAAIFVPVFNPNTQNFNSDIKDSQSTEKLEQDTKQN